MAKLPRMRERTATVAELADGAERYQRAKEKGRRASQPAEGNLCACLVAFARWRRCCVCQSPTLFVNERARADGDFECGLCQRILEDLAKKLARPFLRTREAPRLRSLFSTANDNATAVAL